MKLLTVHNRIIKLKIYSITIITTCFGLCTKVLPYTGKFSRISRFLLFREIKLISRNNRHAGMPHLLYCTRIIRENIFRKFLFRENLAPRKFPGIRYDHNNNVMKIILKNEELCGILLTRIALKYNTIVN